MHNNYNFSRRQKSCTAKIIILTQIQREDSIAISKVTGHRLDGLGSILSRDRDYILHRHTQTGSEAHTASYPKDATGSFSRDRVDRAS
jgi:hypothetical protein